MAVVSLVAVDSPPGDLNLPQARISLLSQVFRTETRRKGAPPFPPPAPLPLAPAPTKKGPVREMFSRTPTSTQHYSTTLNGFRRALNLTSADVKCGARTVRSAPFAWYWCFQRLYSTRKLLFGVRFDQKFTFIISIKICFSFFLWCKYDLAQM